jgi:hypothetical protein
MPRRRDDDAVARDGERSRPQGSADRHRGCYTDLDRLTGLEKHRLIRLSSVLGRRVRIGAPGTTRPGDR